MELVHYDTQAYSRMHEIAREDVSDEGKIPHDGDISTLPSRLQGLLHIVRNANESDKDRMPLDDFLARLQEKSRDIAEVRSDYMKLSASDLIWDTLCSALDKLDIVQNEGTRTMLQYEAPLRMKSQATQTELHSTYFEELLEKARDEAYRRGLSDAKEKGLKEGEMESKDMGKPEGFTTERMQGWAEALEDMRKFEPQYGLEVGNQLGWNEGAVKGVARTKEEAGENIPKNFPAGNKAVVKGCQGTNDVKGEKTSSTLDLTKDPFRSLLAAVKEKHIVEK